MYTRIAQLDCHLFVPLHALIPERVCVTRNEWRLWALLLAARLRTHTHTHNLCATIHSFKQLTASLVDALSSCSLLLLFHVLPSLSSQRPSKKHHHTMASQRPQSILPITVLITFISIIMLPLTDAAFPCFRDGDCQAKDERLRCDAQKSVCLCQSGYLQSESGVDSANYAITCYKSHIPIIIGASVGAVGLLLVVLLLVMWRRRIACFAHQRIMEVNE